MRLTGAMLRLATRILEANQHEQYAVNICTDAVCLRQLTVCQNVLRPELVASLHLAMFLSKHPELYRGKTVIDMGAGSGIQGVLMAVLGAKRVFLTDVAAAAVENSRANVEAFGIRGIAEVFEGDLFESVPHRADVVVFNHPFFAADPIEGIPVSAAIMDRGDLIHRFLDDTPRFAAKLIMPFFHPAGEVNDPGIQAPKHGYGLVCASHLEAESGLNRGPISIYEFGCPTPTPIPSSHARRTGAGQRGTVDVQAPVA